MSGKILPIEDPHWLQIMSIQSEAYCDVAPEPLQVLQSKQRISPQTCCVAVCGSVVQGYVLAHPWPGESPPKLSHVFEDTISSDQLFLHDLALSNVARGQGIAKALVLNLLEASQQLGFQSIQLVAVQGSSGFWQTFGFKPVHASRLDSSYGVGAQLMQVVL